MSSLQVLTRRSAGLFVGTLLLAITSLALLASSGCGISTGSYTRFRQASGDGRMIRSEEVRVADFVNRFAQEDAVPAVLDSEDGAALFVDARLAAPTVPREGATAILGVTVRGVPRTTRYASDLVILLDVSGSMESEDKIGAVRQSLARLIGSLDPDDRMAIVTFANDAHVALPLTRVRDSRDTILRAIGQLRASGATNLYAGLEVASRIFDGTTTPNARLLVLTDGVANMGVTSPDAMLYLTQQIAARRVSVTSVGVGRDIDDGLLAEMAHVGGGSYEFIDGGSEIERVFGTFARSLTELSALRAELVVEAPMGARILRAYHDRAAIDPSGRAARIPFGDVGASDASVSLFEVALPPGAGAGAIPVRVRFTNTTGLERFELEASAPFVQADVGVYHAIDASEPGLLRAFTMGEVALAVREAARAEEGLDASASERWIASALRRAEQAQADLRFVDPLRAESLSEPIALLRRTHERFVATWPAAAMGPTAEPAPGGIVVVGGSPEADLSPRPSDVGFAGWRR